MTRTEDIIGQLAADVKPVGRGAAAKRLAAGIAVGGAVGLALLVAWLGMPFELGAAAVARKSMFPVTIFIVACILLLATGRPGRDIGHRWLWLLIPPAIVAVSAAMELASALPQDREQVWLGSTWQRCLLAILVLSLPVFAGVTWACRRLAPTRLRMAGLLAGVTAGSASAALYALYCPETTATFLLSWYSLGILGAGLVGLLAGPKLLRW
jgi:hypothetical protein